MTALSPLAICAINASQGGGIRHLPAITSLRSLIAGECRHCQVRVVLDRSSSLWMRYVISEEPF